MGCVHAINKKMSSASYAAAVAASSGMKPSLDIGDITLDCSKVEKTKEVMKTKEKEVYLHTPPGTAKSLMKRTVLFRIMNSKTKKIENASTDEVIEFVNSIPDEIKFIKRARRFGTIKIQFEREIVKYAMRDLNSQKW